MAHVVVPVTPDTPEWERERLASIGASEVPAVLGLSPWQTPLGVYRAKMGVPGDMDRERAFIGHKAEDLIEGWIREFRPELGEILPAIMVRSVEYPWLHASLDRRILTADGEVPVQMKSAHFFGVKDWEHGTPLLVQAQVQPELLCADAPYGYAAVFGGDMRVRLHRVDRDEDFLNDFVIPRTRDFWEGHVIPRIAPEPSTFSEVAEVYPSEPGTSLVGSEQVLEAADERAVLLSDMQEMKAKADALTLAIAQYLGTNETLLAPTGEPVLTYRSQRGARRVTDLDELEQNHPEFVTRGADFKVMRMSRKKNPQ